MGETSYRPTLFVKAATSDGATLMKLPPGDYEATALNGYSWISDCVTLSSSNYNTDGFPVPREGVFTFRLNGDRDVSIYNPTGVDTYVRALGR